MYIMLRVCRSVAAAAQPQTPAAHPPQAAAEAAQAAVAAPGVEAAAALDQEAPEGSKEGQDR